MLVDNRLKSLGIHCWHYVLCARLFYTILPFKNSYITIKKSLGPHFTSNIRGTKQEILGKRPKKQKSMNKAF